MTRRRPAPALVDHAVFDAAGHLVAGMGLARTAALRLAARWYGLDLADLDLRRVPCGSVWWGAGPLDRPRASCTRLPFTSRGAARGGWGQRRPTSREPGRRGRVRRKRPKRP